MKYENVDLFSAMEEIMKTNTEHYQSDFEIDKEEIKKAVTSKNPEDKRRIWLSRPSGTHLLRERDVFIQDSRENNTFKYFAEQSTDKILAYTVEITGIEKGQLKGNLYELDYQKKYEQIKKEQVLPDTVVIHYENGDKIQPFGKHFSGYPDPELGKYSGYDVMPKNQDELRSVLSQEKQKLGKMKTGEIKEHIDSLVGIKNKSSIRTKLLQKQSELKNANRKVEQHKKVAGMDR